MRIFALKYGKESMEKWWLNFAESINSNKSEKSGKSGLFLANEMLKEEEYWRNLEEEGETEKGAFGMFNYIKSDLKYLNFSS